LAIVYHLVCKDVSLFGYVRTQNPEYLQQPISWTIKNQNRATTTILSNAICFPAFNFDV